jgi:hypothetical protein
MAQPEGEKGKRSILSSNLFGALVGAVVGAAALLLGGVQATLAAHSSDRAQAQLQVETTRRSVYAEFLTSAADVCTTLSVRPFDKSRSDSAFSAFVGKAGAVSLVAPQDVQNEAQKINDYLAEVLGSRSARTSRTVATTPSSFRWRTGSSTSPRKNSATNPDRCQLAGRCQLRADGTIASLLSS